ncbi:VQ motif-containing protein 8, chloroplastic-like [Argentina anserina]|uniref:VQ motif-containing protein 8, chloroplastic-like n=1 Tax=Argentina anserina TaxID=57926 RepID=UPI0021766AE2|nr:VQ motif-containing protein 8, chloroplastic-like [Potentilla anserina]
MFNQNEQRSVARRETTMSGNRPTPLKINRDSHLIHKQQPSRMAGSQGYHQQQEQQRRPVIIYTYSPKVIHTRPHDFMALVQKLTGLSRSDENQTHKELAAYKTLHARQVGDHKDDSTIADRSINDNETSSGMTDEISGGDIREEENVNVGGDVQADKSCFKASSAGPNRSFSGFSPMQQQNQHPYFADIPMFTPTSMNQHQYFCSPRPLNRFPDSSSQISPSTLCGSISPSMFKFIKGLPE